MARPSIFARPYRRCKILFSITTSRYGSLCRVRTISSLCQGQIHNVHRDGQVTGCHLTRQTRVSSVADDVESSRTLRISPCVDADVASTTSLCMRPCCPALWRCRRSLIHAASCLCHTWLSCNSSIINGWIGMRGNNRSKNACVTSIASFGTQCSASLSCALGPGSTSRQGPASNLHDEHTFR